MMVRLQNLGFCLLFAVSFSLKAQDRTVGIKSIDKEVMAGYTLFSPAANTTTYLINECGQLVNSWVSEYRPGNAVYLEPDGYLYRAGRLNNLQIHAGGAGGIIEKFNWEGEVVWSFEYNSPTYRAHHDFQVLPNGNVLILAWELKDRETSIENGRDPELLSEDELWPEEIIEVRPVGSNGGDIVWEWHAWDHMIQFFDPEKRNYGNPSEHPKKIDINYIRPGVDGADWQHANSLDYNAELDQIMLSVLFFDEIWVINHDTTTEEAAGPAGDLLFRWGNPQAYSQGGPEDQQLFGQHDAHWIEAGLPDEGKIMVFNNGVNRPEGLYSSVVKLDIGDGSSYPRNQNNRFLPENFLWEFKEENPTDFYSRFISGAHQLENGNVFVTSGAHGTFFEIDAEGSEVWRYVSPITIFGVAEQGMIVTNPVGEGTNPVFRAKKYPVNYQAFTGKDLTVGLPIETNPDVLFCTRRNLIEPENKEVALFPNPTADFLNVTNYSGGFEIFNLQGQLVKSGTIGEEMQTIQVSALNSGLYIIKLQNQEAKKILIK
jgi:hypothetical protein